MSTPPKKKAKATGKGKEVLKMLQPVAASLGVDIEADRIAPQVDITKPISHVARTLGQVLRRVNIFIQGDTIVTVDEITGAAMASEPRLRDDRASTQRARAKRGKAISCVQRSYDGAVSVEPNVCHFL